MAELINEPLKQNSMYPQSTSLNRKEDIILKMSRTEFKNVISIIEENTTFIGGADDLFCKTAIKRVKSINRMLLRNNLKNQINW